MENKTDIAVIQQTINKEISNPAVLKSLLEITFKGLTQDTAKRAMLEAMMRRFTFQDFLDKNVYAIPYGQGYSLVNSIDYNRKVGMRSGVVGVSAPKYVDNVDGNPITCEMTIKRNVSGTIGDFTALVYFKEYYAGNKNEDGAVKTNKYGNVKPNLWDTKPRTMISKVAEMHALRKACPEELSQSYIEEEMEREVKVVIDETNNEKNESKKEDFIKKLTEAKDLTELRNIWQSIPGEFKTDEVNKTKDTLRDNFEKQLKK